MPHIKILRHLEDPGIQGLFGKAEVAEGTSAWFQTLAQTTLERNEQVFLAVATDDQGEAQAALPLVETGGVKLRALTSPYTTIYAPLFSNPSWAYFLGSQAKQFVPNSLQLDSLDPANPGTSAFLEGLDSSGLVKSSYAHFRNWFEDIPDFDSYWSQRPSRLRSTVRRKFASLARSHSLQFHVEMDGDGLERSLTAYLEVYRSSWKPAEPHPHFIQALVRRLSQTGAVRLGTMVLDEVVVASQIWLVHRGGATIFKLAHRHDSREYSPGTLLTHWMLKNLIRKESLSEVDFGRGNDDYKRDWLSQSRQRYGVMAANWRTPAGMVSSIRDVMRTRLSNFVRAKSLP